MASTHFSSHKPIRSGNYNRAKIPTSKILSSSETWISARKIKEVLHQFKAKKAAGPDWLKPKVFSHLPEKYFRVLEIIYKAMIF